MDQKLPEAHRRWKEKTNGERGGGKIRGFLRVVPELEILQHQQGWCCEWTPCLRWRRAPISIPPLDLSLILARLCGEGGDYVGEHYWQEGRHGAVRASMKADECTWSLDFCFLCLVHVSLPLRRKEDAVVFVYVSLRPVAMKTCFAFSCSMCKQIAMALPYLEEVLLTWVVCSNFLAHS